MEHYTCNLNISFMNTFSVECITNNIMSHIHVRVCTNWSYMYMPQ